MCCRTRPWPCDRSEARRLLESAECRAGSGERADWLLETGLTHQHPPQAWLTHDGMTLNQTLGSSFEFSRNGVGVRQIHYGLLDASGGNVPWTGVQSLKPEAQLSRPPRNQMVNGPHWVSSWPGYPRTALHCPAESRANANQRAAGRASYRQIGSLTRAELRSRPPWLLT